MVPHAFQLPPTTQGWYGWHPANRPDCGADSSFLLPPKPGKGCNLTGYNWACRRGDARGRCVSFSSMTSQTVPLLVEPPVMELGPLTLDWKAL